MAARIVTLTMNPAIDLSTSVDAVEPTRKMRCGDVHRDPGGGGINVARVLRRFGADVLAIYLAGGTAGTLLERLVERENIAGLVIGGRHETRENFTVFERKSGEQYRFVLPGPRVDEAALQDTLRAVGGLDKGGFLVVSGSLPPGAPASFYADVARIASARGVKLVLDSSGAALKEGLPGNPFLIKPNLRELGELAGGPLAGAEAARGAAAKLVEDGHVQMVALTLGADGALLATRDGVWRAAAPAVDVVSAVGAGDSFLAAMVLGLASGLAAEEAFRRGVAAGSAALLSPGTELCRAEDAERLAREVRVEKI